MGNLAKDAKDLILGNDGSDKESVDLKTALQKAINDGLITKAEGTLLLTSRENCEKLAKLISRAQEEVVVKAAKEDGISFDTLEEAKEYQEQQYEIKKDKDKKERERKIKEQEKSLEQQIKESQNVIKAKMKSERELENNPIERK